MEDNLIRMIQLEELSLLKKLLIFFKENNIKYYALGGTLLGAVRHKGFIPWDDDIDIGVPRKDYEKLLNLLQEGKSSLCYHHFFNDKNAGFYILRIESSQYKVILNNFEKEKEQNIWIDIFPLDGMPDNPLLRKIHELAIRFSRNIYLLSCFEESVKIKKGSRSSFKQLITDIIRKTKIYRLITPSFGFHLLDKTLKRVSYEKSNYLVNVMGAYTFKEMFEKKYYQEGKNYPFEDIEICGPTDYDFVLKQLYGDYLQLPKIEDRNHHDVERIIKVEG